MITKVIIAAGGSGTRMKDYLADHGVVSKSLIPICNQPIVFHLVELIRPYVEEIVITSNKEQGLQELQKLSNSDVRFVHSKGNGPACFPENFATEPFFFLYGHSLFNPDHLQLLEKKFNGDNVVFTGLTSSSEFRPTVVLLNSNGLVIQKRYVEKGYQLKTNEVFVEPPFLLTPKFASMVAEANGDGATKINPVVHVMKNELISIVPATFPHEFHYEHEVSTLEQYAKTILKEIQ